MLPRMRTALSNSSSRLSSLTRLLVCGLPLLSACTVHVDPTPLPEPPLVEGCNPLGGGPGEDCLSPFPSNYYLRTDAQNVRRVTFPPGVLPTSRKGVPLDPALFASRDGFSPATPILVYFPTPIDGQNLPQPSQPEASLQVSSPIQLIAMDTGTRIPLFAELDRNAGPGERQALIIHPQLRLAPKTRYAVAISGLKSPSGQDVPPLAGFLAIRDGDVEKTSIRGQLSNQYNALFSFLAQKGIAQQSLQLAWDFTTGDDAQLTGQLVAMRDAAIKALRPTDPMDASPLLTIDKVESAPKDPLLRQVIGTFRAPSFLSDDTNGRLLKDASGQPKLRGYGRFPLVVHIPKCVQNATAPVPVMIYGHGLFGGALGEMDSGYQREIVQRLCMVQVGSDWIGLTQADALYAANQVMSDFNNFVQLTDRLQQAHTNFAVLARIIKDGSLAQLAELKVGGKVILDSSQVYYYGISNGGVQGLTFLALSPDVKRGALNVPGGFWNVMMWRSANFQSLLPLLSASYSDPFDRQVLIALSQSLWDHTDPATYAPYVVKAPLPGTGGAKQVLYQEGIADAQVPNLTTRMMVRTMGLPLLSPSVESPWGITQAQGPVPSAYVQFDIGQLPRLGDDNVPPKNNAVHEAIRRLEAAKEQLQDFLKDGGTVRDTCKGKPCVFTSGS